MNTRAQRAGLIAVGLVAGLALAPTTVQAAVNYFDTTKIVSGTGTVTCPSGWRLTGGGVAPLPNNSYGSITSTEYEVTSSYPSSTTAWKATGRRISGSYSSTNGWRFTSYSYSPRAYAICTS